VGPDTPLKQWSVAEAVRRAGDLAGRPQRTIVGITGAPGAGKSTLSAAIAAAVPSTVIVPMDGFHLLNEVLVQLGRRNRKGAPDTFDVEAYVALLRRLRTQRHDETIRAPLYDRALSEPLDDALTVKPAVRLILTEGNYLLHDQLGWQHVRPLLDEVWFVDVPDEVRVPRLIARHIYFGKSADAAREWVTRSDETNARLVATTRHRSDACVALDDWPR
jgi:pantothenate kinase